MVKVQSKPAAAGQTTEPVVEEKVKAKKREDFAEGQDGWVAFCEYKRVSALKRVDANQKAAEKWERRKAGEHLQAQEKKLARVDKLKDMLAKLQAELEGTPAVETPVAAAPAVPAA